MIIQSYKQQYAQQLSRKFIPIQPCEVCGSTHRIHRHHPDYDKPLEVMFLCPKHHQIWHSKYKAKNYVKLPPIKYEDITKVYTGRYKLKTRLKLSEKKIKPEDLHYILDIV